MNTKFELYKKCVKGECTPEEASQVEAWLREDPKAFEEDMLAELMEMNGDQEMPSHLKRQMLDNLRQKGVPVPGDPVQEKTADPMREKTTDPVQEKTMQPLHRNIRWVKWTVAAAAAILGLVVGIRFLHHSQSDTASLAWIKVRNDSRVAKQVFLPDSSRVWLNTFAEISYPADLDKQAQREVKLEGEACFIVKGKAERSFVVVAGSLQTWVLGTEFNIEAYPDEDIVKVSLQQGKVRVNYINTNGTRSEGQMLEPGQVAMYRKSSSLLSIGKTATAEPSAWIKEDIVLNDVSLKDAFQRIGQKYSHEILFDTVAIQRYRHLTAHYRDLPMDQVLTQLGFSCNFKFKKVGNKYTISFMP